MIVQANRDQAPCCGGHDDPGCGAPAPPVHDDAGCGAPVHDDAGCGAPPARVLRSLPVAQQAPLWRREPYRVFFPVGALMAWAGVSKWLALSLGAGVYSSAFHSIAQVQGFVMAFAVGFLFTAIPRRTGTAAPRAWQIVVGLLGTAGTSACAAAGMYAASQVLWLLLVGVMLEFALRRFLSATARNRPPNSFVWVPLALLMGVSGSVMMSVYGALGREPQWLHHLGKVVLTQGMVIGLVLGVGGMLIPMITRGETPPDGAATTRDRLARAAHALGAALLVASFVIEVETSPQAGYALRAAVCTAALLLGARLWRLPTERGWHRWLVWAGAWCLPVGLALAAAMPGQAQAGLHVAFIGCFGMLTLAVGIHVALAHGGADDLLEGRPWQVVALGALLLVALVARVAMVHDPARLWLWMGVSAAAFLASTLPWALLVLPRLRPR